MIKVKNGADMGEIYLYGDIIDDANGAFLESWGEGDGFQWPAEIRAQLDALKGKPLTIYINSDGGEVAAGVAIANMIARHDAPTRAVVDGWCCSIATQAFFASDSREMPENAYLMIHKPWTAVRGDADDLLRAAEFLDTLQKGLETTYNKAARDGVTAEKVHEMTEAETWLTGAEAAALFDITLTEAAPVLNCYGGAKARAMKRPGKITLVENTAKPDTATPIFSAENHEKEAAKVKAVLAITKGVMTR